MTRNQRKQKRTRIFCIVCAASIIAELVLIVIGAVQVAKREVNREPYNPPEVIKQMKKAGYKVKEEK